MGYEEMGQYLEKADKALAAIKTAPGRPVTPNDINDFNDLSLHGIPLSELREIAGPDWPEVERDPALLETLAHAVSIRRMRERGEVPPSYTATAVCAGCGPVPIFPGVSEQVDGCPWCFNRIKGLPVPRVATLVGGKVGTPYAGGR